MGKYSYEVALKAVQDDRAKRYKTIDEYIDNWHEALILDKVNFQ